MGWLLDEHAMLGRGDIRAWHTRTVLRRMYRLAWHRRITEPNPLNTVIHSVPPDMSPEEAERYRKFHTSRQFGV